METQNTNQLFSKKRELCNPTEKKPVDTNLNDLVFSTLTIPTNL